MDYQKQIPHPKNYEIGIPNMLFRIYKDMWVNREDTVMDTFIFKDREKAITVIKNFMLRGASTFLCFNKDYSRLIITKNEHTEEYIKSKTKKKEESEEK